MPFCDIEHFPEKPAIGLDPMMDTGFRQENATKQRLERFPIPSNLKTL
jgi:hypothetical protein